MKKVQSTLAIVCLFVIAFANAQAEESLRLTTLSPIPVAPEATDNFSEELKSKNLICSDAMLLDELDALLTALDFLLRTLEETQAAEPIRFDSMTDDEYENYQEAHDEWQNAIDELIRRIEEIEEEISLLQLLLESSCQSDDLKFFVEFLDFGLNSKSYRATTKTSPKTSQADDG